VEIPRRAELARYLAPAAFLLALTIAVLLVRAGLGGGDGGGSDTRPLTGLVTERTTTARTTRSTRTTTQSAKRYYSVEAGDTFDTIAAKFDTTTEQLLALNPDVDPHALKIGQKVRVG
jgi:LysM repeat protein